MGRRGGKWLDCHCSLPLLTWVVIPSPHEQNPMIDYRSRMCCCFAAILCCCVPTLADAAKKAPTRKVVLIAGELDGAHPKGTHEYEKTVRLLKHCLETSPNLKDVKAEVHFHG